MCQLFRLWTPGGGGGGGGGRRVYNEVGGVTRDWKLATMSEDIILHTRSSDNSPSAASGLSLSRHTALLDPSVMRNRLTRKIAKRAGSSIQYLEDEESTVTVTVTAMDINFKMS